jgi:hypothetical protein
MEMFNQSNNKRKRKSQIMKNHIFTDALKNADFPTVIAALHQDVVFYSPLLATLADEVKGHGVVVKVLQAAIACYGLPQNVEEFQNSDGRYVVTPCSSPRMPRIWWKAFACLPVLGRSSSSSGKTWSATCVPIRSPTPFGLCRQLHRESA